ncbi:MAG: hypothetical protein BRC58_10260 [Cyanobacteria bacterium QS_8_64_29]|nr:MAG: hypothetical protein BRC58_10260 [Cyanobacteria bacterium QS_8_64_29]
MANRADREQFLQALQALGWAREMPRPVAQLNEQFADSQCPEQKIRSNLASLGYDADAEVNP